MIAISPKEIPATASAARAKNRFSHTLPFSPMNRCGSAIVTQAPKAMAQMKVTQLMRAGGRTMIPLVDVVAP